MNHPPFLLDSLQCSNLRHRAKIKLFSFSIPNVGKITVSLLLPEIGENTNFFKVDLGFVGVRVFFVLLSPIYKTCIKDSNLQKHIFFS
jgi:hypothetical protein